MDDFTAEQKAFIEGRIQLGDFQGAADTLGRILRSSPPKKNRVLTSCAWFRKQLMGTKFGDFVLGENENLPHYDSSRITDEFKERQNG